MAVPMEPSHAKQMAPGPRNQLVHVSCGAYRSVLALSTSVFLEHLMLHALVILCQCCSVWLKSTQIANSAHSTSFQFRYKLHFTFRAHQVYQFAASFTKRQLLIQKVASHCVSAVSAILLQLTENG